MLGLRTGDAGACSRASRRGEFVRTQKDLEKALAKGASPEWFPSWTLVSDLAASVSKRPL